MSLALLPLQEQCLLDYQRRFWDDHVSVHNLVREDTDAFSQADPIFVLDGRVFFAMVPDNPATIDGHAEVGRLIREAMTQAVWPHQLIHTHGTNAALDVGAVLEALRTLPPLCLEELCECQKMWPVTRGTTERRLPPDPCHKLKLQKQCVLRAATQ